MKHNFSCGIIIWHGVIACSSNTASTTKGVSQTCVSGITQMWVCRKLLLFRKQMARVTHGRARLRCMSVRVCVWERERYCVYLFDVEEGCVCVALETRGVRRQTDRQMDRQAQDPTPLQGHSAETFNLQCIWHLRLKCTRNNLIFFFTVNGSFEYWMNIK